MVVLSKDNCYPLNNKYITTKDLRQARPTNVLCSFVRFSRDIYWKDEAAK